MVTILVIATMVTCVVVDSIIRSRQKQSVLATSFALNTLSDNNFDNMEMSQLIPHRRFREADYLIPMGVFFHKGHTWANLLFSGHVKVGMDDFARRIIGKVEAIYLPDIGQQVRQGEKLFTVRQSKKEAVFRSPIDGTIIDSNKKLTVHPDILKSDPYLEGWVCVLKPSNFCENLKNLKIAKDAAAWFKEEISRFKDLLMGRTCQLPELGQILQDGGEMVEGILELLDEKTWKSFNKEFLT